MVAAKSTGNNANGGGNENNTEKTVAKTAGFVVFSGIAISILKALNPYNNTSSSSITNSPQESTPIVQETAKPLPIQDPIIKKPKPVVVSDVSAPSTLPPSRRTIEIVKGDTLWALSRKYGVSVGAIKDANGLTGDTIYAGKKLVIP